MATNELRVRFAPSPTGPFHIGGARSALFNWLLAQKQGGKMILRIEDTDLERSSRESEENIKAALKWLGLTWDEGIDVGGPYGPYRQTERLSLYETYTKKLLESGQAYYCYCTDEELEAERQACMAKGELPRYSGKCKALTDEEKAKLEAEGRKPTIRFRVPANQQIVFKDLVRGTVAFDSNGIGDYVIVKSDGIPTYNYAVVIDDATMHINQVIRAEEHLSNTPRQVLIYEALGLPVPEFGHISLILGKDRTKMSKRHGATSVEQYRKLGYLPEALVNFLALLGWAPDKEQEIFSLEELVQEFSMDRVAKNPAVFDVDKLNWLNAHYLRQTDLDRLTELALPAMIEAGYVPEQYNETQKAYVKQILHVIQDHISYAAQITDFAPLFYGDEIDFESDEARAILQDSEVEPVLALFKEKLLALPSLDEAALKALLKSITKELKVGGKKVFMPVRVAITGQVHGPDLARLIPVLGVERTLKRLDRMMSLVTNHG